MARWAAGAKWAAGPAPDDQRDTPLVLSLSEGLGNTVADYVEHTLLVAGSPVDATSIHTQDFTFESSPTTL